MSDDENIYYSSDVADEEDRIQSSSSQRKKKGKTSATEEYKLTNTLKAPRATTYAASSLNEQITRGDIELNPEYQRDVVWSTQKQIGLIDSIFRNFYVPPIIFATTSHEDGSETKTCIDGKQRLTSIHLFMNGVIPHRDADTGRQYWFDNANSKQRELLPERYRSIFSNKQIVCVEYQELKDTDERDIFTRVQLGMALTVAEKLQAISTPRADLIRHLMQTFLTPTTLTHPDIPWDRSRGRDFQILGTVIYSLFKWDKHMGLKTWVSTVVLEKWLNEAETSRKKPSRSSHGEDGDEHTVLRIGVPVDEGFKDAVIRTFETVVKLATTKRYSSPFRASNSIALKVSPIEMAGAFILVHVVHTAPPKTYKKEVTLAGLSALYVLLRKKLRDEHQDIRSNGKVGRTMVEFCLEASNDPVTTIVMGEDEGLLEGEVEDDAKWTRSRERVSEKRTKVERARARAQKESTDEEGEQLEDEEITLPVKRRRSSGGSLLKGRASGSSSLRSANHYSDQSAPTDAGKAKKKPSKLSRVALPTPPLPSPGRALKNLLSSRAQESPSPPPDEVRASSSDVPTPFAIPSLPLSSSPSLLTPCRSTPPSTPTAPPQAPTPEQLLAAMGVSVPTAMIPTMIAQMKSFVQGATQTLPDPSPSQAVPIPPTGEVRGQTLSSTVKDEGEDPAEGFAAELAQNIGCGAVSTDVS
ncbi:hypothetical protein E1B28_010656 [Marasmius oreades]|uniref:GmrSD restriction endonucleases N-terminal domain-containing protein n=1 Tax=Marasmius oreades TaxID=181124 RepID=A0A9P7RXQ3_9AGAR|nr:uncharacterized protein E1B28_010656 [Marasmius oreades]KAG7091635.1 hypothetical protein E1B28_010656 [Marasmius oreades]